MFFDKVDNNKILNDSVKFRTQDKPNQIFMDVYEPPFRGVIDSEIQLFKLDSIEKIEEGCAARIVLRNEETNKLITYIPMQFSYDFSLSFTQTLIGSVESNG